MSDKIPTAEEYFNKRYKELGINHSDEIEDEDVIIAKELIQIHVEAALKAASKKAKMKVQPSEMEEWTIVPDEITREDVDDEESGCEDFCISINKQSILDAYPKENIK